MVHRTTNLGTPSPFFMLLFLLPLRSRRGPGTPPVVRPRPRPAPSPQGQEARKEPPGAMDGAVMEGPLFLQSQRFGTKVVGGRGCGTPSDLGVDCRAQRERGEAAGWSAGRELESPMTFPRS